MVWFFPCNLIKAQCNQLGSEQCLKSKSKIRLFEEERERIIAAIFLCSSETVALISNLKSLQSALYEHVQSKCEIHKVVTQDKWCINFVADITTGICGVI